MTIQQALAALKDQDIDKALEITGAINSNKESKTFISLGIEGGGYKEKGELNKALELYLEALTYPANQSQKINVFHNIAVIYSNTDRHSQACEYMEDIIALVPVSSCLDLRLDLGKIYLGLFRYERALEVIAPLLDNPKTMIAALCVSLDASFKQSSMAKAKRYLKALEAHMDQLNPELLFYFVDRYSQIDTVKAETLIKKFEDSGVGVSNLLIIKARMVLENKDPELALRLLSEDFIQTISDKKQLSLAYSIRAKSLDQLNKFADAFKNFTVMNNFSAATIKEEIRNNDAYPELVNLDSVNISLSNQVDIVNVCFIVGFPRSGTTLLENILNSQKHLYTLDEKPMLSGVIKKIRNDGYRYPQDLASFQADYLLSLRNEYVEILKTFLPDNRMDSNRLVIDKGPTHMMAVPLIKAIFPKAKIILALRHPLDSILSCYMQNFNMNVQMHHFTDWKNCFLRYTQLFTLYEGYKYFIDFDEHIVRYEDLIHDFENTTESLFEFLEIEYDLSYKQFHKMAQKRIVNTASRTQVKEALYSSSENRYQNYWQFVEPNVKEVDKFIELYGYKIKGP